jgi:hypothetical protein
VRVPHPAGRRAKLIVPTERGRRLIAPADQIIADLEAEYAAKVGRQAYDQFVRTLSAVTERWPGTGSRSARGSRRASACRTASRARRSSSDR